MRFIIDCEGPVLDVQPCHWAGYSAACAELGLARMDPASFWRAVRRGAGDGELVRGAKPAKLRDFRRSFDEHRESDECAGCMQPQPGAAAALGVLRRSGQCILVTLGANARARQAILDAADLSVHFSRMKALSADRGRRVDQLGVLSEGDRHTVVAAASESMILAAEEAGLFAVGVCCGAATAARLARAGARCNFADLAELAECLDRNGDDLVAAGLTAPT